MAKETLRQKSISINGAHEATITESEARAWVQQVDILTYPEGAPTKYPMYFDRRVYQGSSGKIYPLPLTERVGGKPEMRRYEVLFLENEYIKVMVLPQFGGKIHMLYDKIRDYHAVYFNRVIKPALVGLVGPWISGGIEFNWPQHHRPSTYMPVSYTIASQGPEQAEIQLSEIDSMYGTRVTTSLVLKPEDARIHITSEVSNRTNRPQTFLWWANPAVPVHDAYQAVFPSDVHAVFDHGKRDVSRFPIADSIYYKVDYSPGVDISYYRNVPVPTSYMAHYSRQDFVGGYDHNRQAGILHSAEHRYSPGKKMWTWGTGDFAKAWERNLTDEDGPYVELMTGIYTDNQPDFTWLAPGETKQFHQVFYPFADLPKVLCANHHGACYAVQHGDTITLSVFAPSIGIFKPTCTVDGSPITLEAKQLTPEHTAMWKIQNVQGSLEAVSLADSDGIKILHHHLTKDEHTDQPESAQVPDFPNGVATVDELYGIGIHLEQYRHASYDPEWYYREALDRDPGDVRTNIAMARRYIDQFDYQQALLHSRRAAARLCRWNTNPQSGEAHYLIGLSSSILGDSNTAREALFKATWAADTIAQALYELAVIEHREKSYQCSVQYLKECLEIHPTHERAQHLLMITSLRHAGSQKPAFINHVVTHHLSFLAACEQWFSDEIDWETLWKIHLGENEHRLMDVAAEYLYVGCYEEVLKLAEHYRKSTEHPYPLPFYMAAYAAQKEEERSRWLSFAEALSPDMVFPIHPEAVTVLYAAAATGSCPKACLYLGNVLYAKGRHRDAYEFWVHASMSLMDVATVFRNRALYEFDRVKRPEQALASMQNAYRIDPEDSRLLVELDELHRLTGSSPEERLRLLESCKSILSERDDLTLRYASLLTSTGSPETARTLLLNHWFTPWEGGEGMVPWEYRRAVIASALTYLETDTTRALTLLESAITYPVNLGEGKLPNTPDNEINYWIGIAHRFLDNADQADASFRKATKGDRSPSLSRYYNDVPARSILYQGLAWKALGETEEAESCFKALLTYGKDHLHETIAPDYFAVSYPDFIAFHYDLTAKNHIFCRVIIGLAYLGLGSSDKAQQELQEALTADPNDTDALDHIEIINTIQTL